MPNTPNPQIQFYLNDSRIPEDVRYKAFQGLGDGTINQSQFLQGLQQHYGQSYGTSTDQSQTQSSNKQTSAQTTQPQQDQSSQQQSPVSPGAQFPSPFSPQAGQSFNSSIGGGLIQGTTGGLYQGTANQIGAGMNFLQQNVENPIANAARRLAGEKSENIPLTGNIMEQAGQQINQPSTSGQVGIGPQSDNTAGIVGEVVGNLASQVPAMVAGGEVAKGSQAALGATKGAGLLSAVAGGAPITESAVSGQTGKLASPAELVTGALLDATLHGVGQLASKWAPELYRSVINPVASSSDKMKEYAQNAIDMGLTGSYEDVAKKSQAILDDVGPKLQQAYQNSTATFNPEDLVKDVVDKAADLEKSGAGTKANAIMKQATNFLSTVDPEIGAERLWNIKQTAQNEILSNLKSGAPLTNAQSAAKQVWGSIYDKASGMLEDAVPEVSDLNKQYSTASSVASSVEKMAKRAPAHPVIEFMKAIAKSPTISTFLSSALNNGEALSNPAITGFIKNLAVGAENSFTSGNTLDNTQDNSQDTSGQSQ